MRRYLLLLPGLWLGATVLACAADPEDWYYREGARAGSLRSDKPVPLYDQDPDHLWNRLFAALYIRPGEDPPPGQPRRIEGGDAYLDPLLWPDTTRFTGDRVVIDKTVRLLHEFLQKKGGDLIADPCKRSIFQHDVWAVYDRVARQRPRSAVAKAHAEMVQKMGQVIRSVALSREQLAALPNNFERALKSGHFTAEHKFDPAIDYLPADLPIGPGKSTGAWVEITYPAHVPPYHTHDFGGRSYFRIFYRFPEGRQAVVSYLKYLAEEGIDKDHPDASKRAVLKSKGIRQIPAGTQVALLRQMVVLDKELKPVPTSVVQELRMRVYQNVEGKPDPATTSGEGVNIYSYELKRALAFAEMRHGGLERQPNDLPVYRPLFHFHEDWGRARGREGLAFLPVATHCIACHGHKPGENVGVYSMTSIHAAFSLAGATRNGPPGIVTPMTADAPTQFQRAAVMIQSRQEYRLLLQDSGAGRP